MNKTKEIALLSGSSGFIGKHLKEALQQREIRAIAIPRDILQTVDVLTDFVSHFNPTYIFHLAAFGNHVMQTEEEEIVSSNYLYTWNLLTAGKYTNYRAFINVATSSIYGKKEIPMQETDYLKPDTFYAATKAGAMYLARAYAMQYHKPIVSAIPFSIFGEGEADFRFIPTAIRYMLEGETMPFVGYPTHDWLYVKDFVDGLLTIADHAKELQGEWVNVGSGTMQSNNEVITDLTYIADTRLNTHESYQEQPHHSPVWVGDITKLTSLGWKPKYTFHEALLKTYQYYKQKYDK